MLGKLLHIEEIFDSKCIKKSSVPAMGAYSVPPDPLAGLKEPLRNKKR